MSKTFRYDANRDNDYYTAKMKREQAKKEKKIKRKMKKQVDA